LFDSDARGRMDHCVVDFSFFFVFLSLFSSHSQQGTVWFPKKMQKTINCLSPISPGPTHIKKKFLSFTLSLSLFFSLPIYFQFSFFQIALKAKEGEIVLHPGWIRHGTREIPWKVSLFYLFYLFLSSHCVILILQSTRALFAIAVNVNVNEQDSHWETFLVCSLSIYLSNILLSFSLVFRLSKLWFQTHQKSYHLHPLWSRVVFLSFSLSLFLDYFEILFSFLNCNIYWMEHFRLPIWQTQQWDLLQDLSLSLFLFFSLSLSIFIILQSTHSQSFRSY